MRALIASDNEFVSETVQQVIERAGFECRPTDITSLDTAADCAGRARRSLTVLILPADAERGLAIVRDVRNTTDGMLLVVGPAHDPRFILRLLRTGADEFLDESELDTELEATLARLKTKKQTQAESGKIIGVLSPSGGSGSSMLASNLAVMLAKTHEQTALFDLRLAAGDQTLLLDLEPEHTLADLCHNIDRVDQIMFQQSLVPHSSGARLLAGPKEFSEIPQVTPYGVRQALNFGRTNFPFVVLDIDRSLTAEQVPAVVQADAILLVLRLDMVSLQNTSRVLKYLDEIGVTQDRIRIIVNRYRQPKELPAHKAEKALAMTIFHYIPDDPATANAAINKGVPAVLDQPRAKFSKSLIELAMKVSNWQARHESNGKVDSQPRRAGWFATSTAQ